jgi:hypothetical protein
MEYYKISEEIAASILRVPKNILNLEIGGSRSIQAL